MPATDGRMVQATPIKFCLNFQKNTIGVVYTLEKSKKQNKSGKPRKYIHEVRVDFKSCMASNINWNAKPTLEEIEAYSRSLIDSEPVYLNTNCISKTQVIITSLTTFQLSHFFFPFYSYWNF